MINSAVEINGFYFLNLTPHPLDVMKKDGEIVHFPKPELNFEDLPRVEEIKTKFEIPEEFKDYDFGFNIEESYYGTPINLPEPKYRCLFIVSAIVASTAYKMRRKDFLCPGTLIRNEQGQPIGANGLKRPH